MATPDFAAARHQMAALPVHGWDRVADFRRSQFGEPCSDDVNVEFCHNGTAYRLWVSGNEKDAMRRQLRDC